MTNSFTIAWFCLELLLSLLGCVVESLLLLLLLLCLLLLHLLELMELHCLMDLGCESVAHVVFFYSIKGTLDIRYSLIR